MSIIDKLDSFADSGIQFVSDHSKYLYFGGSLFVFCVFVVPKTIISGLNFLFIAAMVFAALCIGWPLMLIYMLPFGIIQLFCYCVRHPLKALYIFIKTLLACAALFLLGMCIHAL